MKYLFKNSFFSFLKSKVAMVLLVILMLLSTATFTLLSSTSSAFRNSYDQVITQGKLHNFTVKQKYSINGNLNFKVDNIQKNKDTTSFNLLFDKLRSSGNYRELSNDFYEKVIAKEFNDISDSKGKIIIENNKLPSSSSSLSQQQILNIKNISQKLINIKKKIDNYVHDNFENNFKKTITNQYQNQLYETKVKSITVNANKKSFKIINGSNRSKNVNKMVIFQGQDVPKSMNENELKNNANDWRDDAVGFARRIDGKTFVHNGYKAIAYYREAGGRINAPYSYLDPSSLMAVVSPSHFKENNLKVISPEKVKDIYETSLKESKDANPFIIMNKKIRDNYAQQVVWIDNTPYFIVGVGTTPDFSFPIINQENPIPDIKNQANIFVNKNGYKRIEEAFLNNPRENYLSYRFKQNVSKSKQNEIINFIEETAKEKMSWGKNISQVVSKRYDTSETVIMAPHRVSTINNLQKTINSVSYTTLGLLVMFVAFVVILVIKQKINSIKKTLGILLANGYSKIQIAFANTSISFIISFISTIMGYIIGNFLQPAFMLVFKNYWTLPVSPINFDLISLLLTVSLPMFGIALLAFLITIWELRGQISDIINDVSSVSRNLSAKIVAPLKWVNIKTRASLALSVTNLSKMFLIFIAVVGAIIAVSISLSTYNKFNIAKTNSLNSKNYEYKLDLASPTAQGGLMKMMPIEKIGVESTSKAKDIYDPKINYKNLFKKSDQTTYNGKSKFMVPNLNDEINSKKLFYLNGIVQFKSLLNVFVGRGDIGVGPWSIVEKIMPENQLNKANQQYDNFINFTAQIDENLKKEKSNGKSITEILIDRKYLSKDEKGFYKVSNFNKINAIDKNSDGYEILKEFIFNGLRKVIKIYKDPKTPPAEKLKYMPFFLSYRNIISDQNDETFSRVEGEINLVNNQNKKEKRKLNIIGVKPNTNFINFNSNALNNLKSFNDKEYLPVVANQFFLFRYNKKVGDTFEYQISNHKNRLNDDFKPKSIKLKIVGVHNSYANSQLYTLQKKATQVLGWDTNKEEEKNMFNGIFTKNKNSILFKSISLYSLSGLYPSVGVIQKGSDLETKIDNYIKSGAMPGVNNLSAFKRKFSYSPYVMSYKDVNWQYTEQYRFDLLVDISNKLIYIVETITLMLAVLFIFIISLMMIFDNRKFIFIMRIMGYRQREISKIFFMSFFPLLIFGFFIATPIAFGLSEVLKIIIASYGQIYIPISLTWWTLIISGIITFLIFLFVYLISTWEPRKASFQEIIHQN